ncbi:hypothetical protein [Streptomyces sp. NPDC002994]|uniref:hypothetical protein n=1 Tax=Streptomyces sp. NPDC002994 TaxID=3154441 RepID=UPI0033B3475C
MFKIEPGTPTGARAPTTARRVPLFVVGACAPALCAALSLAMGSRPVPMSTVADALFGDGGGSDALVVTGLLSWTSAVAWMSGIGVQADERMLSDVAKATGVELPKK